MPTDPLQNFLQRGQAAQRAVDQLGAGRPAAPRTPCLWHVEVSVIGAANLWTVWEGYAADSIEATDRAKAHLLDKLDAGGYLATFERAPSLRVLSASQVGV